MKKNITKSDIDRAIDEAFRIVMTRKYKGAKDAAS